LGNLIFIAALLAIGYALKSLKLPEDFGKSLNLFVIYISLPATVLLQIPKISISSDLLILAITPWVLLIPMVALAIYLTRGLDRLLRASLLMMLPLGNTSFVGIPMLQALLGDGAIPYILIYDQFGTFLILSIYGTGVIAYYKHGKIDAKQVAKNIITFPAFLALLFSLSFGAMPQLLVPYLEVLANTLVPLGIISVGFALKIVIDSHKKLFIQAISAKILLTPLIALLHLLPLGLEKDIFDVAVLESAMPFMVTSTVLAMNAGFAPQFSASLLGYSIILSLFSVPIFHNLLNFF